MRSEIWKDVDHYQGIYQVSNQGRVRKIAGDKFTILKVAKNKYGYQQVHLRKDGKQILVTIHRLVAEAFIQNPNGLPQINHINGIKTDNRIENLEWTTASDNQRHALKTGLRDTSRYKKPVIAVAITEGVEYSFGSVTEAAKALGTTQSNISHAIKEGYVTKGYRISFKGAEA